MDIFIEYDGDAAEGVDDLNERAPVKMGVVLEVNTEDGANFGHEGAGSLFFLFHGSITATTITPVNFVDFAGAGTSWRSF